MSSLISIIGIAFMIEWLNYIYFASFTLDICVALNISHNIYLLFYQT